MTCPIREEYNELVKDLKLTKQLDKDMLWLALQRVGLHGGVKTINNHNNESEWRNEIGISKNEVSDDR